MCCYALTWACSSRKRDTNQRIYNSKPSTINNDSCNNYHLLGYYPNQQNISDQNGMEVRGRWAWHTSQSAIWSIRFIWQPKAAHFQESSDAGSSSTKSFSSISASWPVCALRFWRRGIPAVWTELQFECAATWAASCELAIGGSASGTPAGCWLIGFQQPKTHRRNIRIAQLRPGLLRG